MILPILISLAVLVVLFVIIVSLRPSEFRVTRSAAIGVPVDLVFEQVNNLHNWQAWSPWAKLDPNARITYDGPESGVGAAFAWVGNAKIGEGRMTITESRPGEMIRFKLQFLKPFKASNTAEFTFKPDAGQTVVTWSMSGRNNFMRKAVGLFMDCDKMCGCQFEKGLAQMKALVEGEKAGVHA
jgi:Polyketide cyclase / dehydrase and lipid transport